MANPFDQFDTQAATSGNPFDAFEASKGNPFDQFDAPSQSDIDAQQTIYNGQNYQPVAISPVDRNAMAPYTSTDAEDAPKAGLTALAQKARELDALPVDTRREVGPGETYWRLMNQTAAGTESLLAGAASAIGYPITAADAALSGRPVPSLSEAVAAGEAPSRRAAEQYALDPSKEKIGLASEVAGAMGQGTADILTMLATGPGRAADAVAGIPEQVAAKIFQTARISSVPAARNARDAAQQAIDDGKTPTEATAVALNAYNSTVAGNALPISAAGNVATRAVTGAGIGAGQAALSGGDQSQIISGAITGGLNAGVFGERAVTPTGAPKLNRVQDLAAQVIDTNAAKGDPAAMGEKAAGEVARQSGVEPNTTEQAKAVAVAEQTAANLDQSAGFTDQATPAVQSVETLKNGKAVLFRGDVDAMRKALAEADIAPGMTKLENGKPVGVYYPATYKDRVAQALKYQEKPNAPENVEVPRQGPQAENAAPEETEAGRAASDQGRSVQPGIDRNEPVTEDDNAAVMYSRIKPSELDRKQLSDDPVVAGLQKLASHDEAFRYPVSDAKTLEGVFKDATDNTAIHEDSFLASQNDHNPDRAWTVHTQEGDANVFEKGKTVWLDVSKVGTGNRGSEIYNAVANYAHNTGKVFIGDPAGLSSMGHARRLENMVSSALKFGTTDHLAPHETQGNDNPYTGTPGFKWTPGDHAGNIRAMALAASEATHRQIPEIANLRYDPKADQIVNREGKVYDDAALRKLASDARSAPADRAEFDRRISSGIPRKIAAGGGSIARAVLTRQLAHGTSEERSQVLAALSRGLPEPYSKTLYSTGDGTRAGVGLGERGRQGGNSTDRTRAAGNGNSAETALQRVYGTGAISRLKRNGVSFHNSEDVVAQKLGGHKSMDELEGVKGFTTGDRSKVVLLNDRISDAEAPGILKHELVHKNLPTLLGESQFRALTKAAERSSDRDVAKARERVPKDTPAEHLGEEALGYLAEQTPDHPLVQKAVDAVKLFLNRMGIPLTKLNGEGAALRKIIALNLKHASREQTHLIEKDGELTRSMKPRMKAPLSVWGDQLGKADNGKNDNTQKGNEDTQLGQTGIKNAQVNAERAIRGSDALESEATKTFGTSWDKAKERAAEDPHYGRTLAQEILAKPRAASQDEAASLLHDRVRIQAEHKAAMADVEKALDAKDDIAQTQARIKLADVEDQLETNDKASRVSGTESGRSLNARKMMAREDYSLANLITRAKIAGGGKVSDKVRRKLEKVAKGIEESTRVIDEEDAQIAAKLPKVRIARTEAGKKSLDDQLTQLKTQLAKIASGVHSKDSVKFSKAPYSDAPDSLMGFRRNGQQTGYHENNYKFEQPVRVRWDNGQEIVDGMNGLNKAHALERARRNWPDAAEVTEATKEEYENHNGESWPQKGSFYSKGEVVSRIGTQAASIVNAIAKNRVMAGSENVVGDVHAAIKDALPVSERDVRDLISGYGHEPQHTKDELTLQMNALKKQLRALSKNEDVAAGKRPSQADKTRQTQLQKQIAGLETQIKTGNFTKAKREAPVYNQDTLKLEAQRDKLQKDANRIIKQQELANQSPAAKAARYALDARRLILLSPFTNPLVMAKLSAAAGYKLVGSVAHEAAGTVLRQIPGLKTVAERADVEGNALSIGNEWNALKNALNGDAAKEFWKVFKTGDSDRSAMFDEHESADPLLVQLNYNIHSAIKTPAKRQAFFRTMGNLSKREYARAIESGMKPDEALAHLGSKEVQVALQAKAYLEEQRAVFQNANGLDTGLKNLLAMAAKKNDAGKIAKFLVNFELPITRVPTNIAYEAGGLAAGAVPAAYRLIKARLAGSLKDISPEDANFIMRNLKRQTVGAALMSIGYLTYKNWGGFYQPGDNKDPNKPKAGEAKIDGHEIPRWVMDSPLMIALQAGATLHRVQQKHGDSVEGGWAAAKGLIFEIPMLEQTRQLGEGLGTSGSFKKWAGAQVAGAITPPIVRQIAKAMDHGRTRKPKTFTDELKMGFPGFREQVSQQ